MVTTADSTRSRSNRPNDLFTANTGEGTADDRRALITTQIMLLARICEQEGVVDDVENW